MLFTVCFGVGKRSVVDFSRHILLTKDKTQHRMMHNTSTVFSASIVDSGKGKGKERFTAAVTVLTATTIYLLSWFTRDFLSSGFLAALLLLLLLLACEREEHQQRAAADDGIGLTGWARASLSCHMT